MGARRGRQSRGGSGSRPAASGPAAPSAPPPRHRAGPSARVPALDECVELPAGAYRVGEPGEERTAVLGTVRIGRYPVVNAHWRAFAAATGRPASAAAAAEALADHPATGVTLADAAAFCAWAAARLGSNGLCLRCLDNSRIAWMVYV